MYFYKIDENENSQIKNSIRCLYNDHEDRIEGADWIKVYVVQVYKRPAKRDIAKGWLQVFTMDDPSHRGQASF